MNFELELQMIVIVHCFKIAAVEEIAVLDQMLFVPTLLFLNQKLGVSFRLDTLRLSLH